MSRLSLQDSLTGTVSADGTRRHTIAENWLQGRSGYGGLTSAICLAAMMDIAEEGRDLRSLQTVFVGPAPSGDVVVEAETLRTGKSTQMVTSRMVTADGVATMATAVFGREREALTFPLPQRHDLPNRDSIDAMPFVKGVVPDALENMELRWVGNGIPFSGSRDHTLGLWVRLKQPEAIAPELRYITIADTHPAAIMSYFTVPTAQSSVTWSLEIVKPLSQTEGEWLFAEAVADAAADGYCQQSTSFYDEAGTLIMLGRQCMAYFG